MLEGAKRDFRGLSILQGGERSAPADETGLAKLETATRMLAEVRSIPEAKHVHDLACAAAAYAKHAKLGREAELHAQAIRLRAERAIGRMLRETPKAQTGPSSTAPGRVGDAPSLADLGIDRKLSAHSQRLAQVSDERFEALLADSRPLRAVEEELRRRRLAELAERPDARSNNGPTAQPVERLPAPPMIAPPSRSTTGRPVPPQYGRASREHASVIDLKMAVSSVEAALEHMRAAMSWQQRTDHEAAVQRKLAVDDSLAAIANAEALLDEVMVRFDYKPPIRTDD